MAVGRSLGNGHRKVLGRPVGKHERCLIRFAGHDIGLLIRLMIDAGTPKEATARGNKVGLLVPLANGSVPSLLAAIAGNYTVSPRYPTERVVDQRAAKGLKRCLSVARV